MRKGFLLAAGLLCALARPICAEDGAHEKPRVFDYPFDKVWDTALAALQSSDWVIREIDKKNGFIAVNWQKLSGPAAELFDETLVNEAVLYRYAYTMIPVNEDSTSVQIKCFTGMQNEFARIEEVAMILKEDIRRWEAQALDNLEMLLVGVPSVVLGVLVEYDDEIDRLKVMKVHPDSLAKKFGIRPHDIIVGINNNDVRTIKGHYKNMKDIKPGDTFVVRVMRNKKTEDITITVPAEGIAPILPLGSAIL